MANKELVRSVAIKQQDGSLGGEAELGSTFNGIVDVIGSRIGATGYSLAQFFDSYQAFMTANPFTYVGPIKPTNTHIALWIDTSVTNQDDFTA